MTEREDEEAAGVVAGGCSIRQLVVAMEQLEKNWQEQRSTNGMVFYHTVFEEGGNENPDSFTYEVQTTTLYLYYTSEIGILWIRCVKSTVQAKRALAAGHTSNLVDFLCDTAGCFSFDRLLVPIPRSPPFLRLLSCCCAFVEPAINRAVTPNLLPSYSS